MSSSKSCKVLSFTLRSVVHLERGVCLWGEAECNRVFSNWISSTRGRQVLLSTSTCSLLTAGSSSVTWVSLGPSPESLVLHLRGRGRGRGRAERGWWYSASHVREREHLPPGFEPREHLRWSLQRRLGLSGKLLGINWKPPLLTQLTSLLQKWLFSNLPMPWWMLWSISGGFVELRNNVCGSTYRGRFDRRE